MIRETSSANPSFAPQPQSSPKVIVPSAASETRSPLSPKSRYCILVSFFVTCRYGPFLGGQCENVCRVHAHAGQLFRYFPESPRHSNIFCLRRHNRRCDCSLELKDSIGAV